MKLTNCFCCETPFEFLVPLRRTKSHQSAFRFGLALSRKIFLEMMTPRTLQLSATFANNRIAVEFMMVDGQR